MEQIKPSNKKNKNRYQGIFVGKEHIFFTSSMSRVFIDLKKRPNAYVNYDLTKGVIEITFTADNVDTFDIRKGVSYTYYISCPIAEKGMPEGRYYYEKFKTLPNLDARCTLRYAHQADTKEAEGRDAERPVL